MTGLQTKQGRKKTIPVIPLAVLALLFFGVFFLVRGSAEQGEEEPRRVEFYYMEVCASCDGTEEFYEIYERLFSAEERRQQHVEIAAYNVFLESNEAHYEQAAEQLGIPDGTSMPVLVVDGRWVSGYDEIEESMRELLMADGSGQGSDTARQPSEEQDDQPDPAASQARQAIREIQGEEETVLLLFTTNACQECQRVKEWMEEQKWLENRRILEYNIAEDDGLELLKNIFRAGGVEEERQEVPAVCIGDMILTGEGDIRSLTEEQLEAADNKDLAGMLEESMGVSGDGDGNPGLLAMAGAGLLAGCNPCSISMLLMLFSLLLSARASVLKNGLIFLAGKYVTYLVLGFVIYVTAAQIQGEALETAGRVMDWILAALFAAAAVLYGIDAVNIYRGDYGHIRTQLPVGLRRISHRLIKKAAVGDEAAGERAAGGERLTPFLIAGLGVAISLGEFFCTGQIYMASITYLLKSGDASVWPSFVIYAAAMSLPTFGITLLIQKTRNTDRISAFFFRHLGLIKILNAALFLGFMIYFLLG